MDVAVIQRIEWYKELNIQFQEWIQVQLEKQWMKVNDYHVAHEFLMDIQTKLSEYKDDDEELSKLQVIQTKYATFVAQYGCNSLNTAVQLILGKRRILQIQQSSKPYHSYPISTLWIILNNLTTVQCVSYQHPNTEMMDYGEFAVYQPEHKQGTIKQFQTSINGIYLVFQSSNTKKSTVFHLTMPPCTVWEIPQLTNISEWRNELKETRPAQDCFHTPSFQLFLDAYKFHTYLFTYQPEDVFMLYYGLYSWSHRTIQQPMSQLIRVFLSASLMEKFEWITNGLLFHDTHHEWGQIIFMLYDLISKFKNETANYEGQSIETPVITTTWEQYQLFQWLPFPLKRILRRKIKDNFDKTIMFEGTDQDLSETLPMEQRIQMMKTTDSVKKRAMTKWREVKLKSDEQSSKAKQYVEGLLKIPFGTYREEPCLKLFEDVEEQQMVYDKIMNETTNTYSFEKSKQWYTDNILIPIRRKQLLNIASFINDAVDVFDIVNHPIHMEYCKFYTPMFPLRVTGKRQHHIKQLIEQAIQWILENVKERVFVFMIHSITCYLKHELNDEIEYSQIHTSNEHFYPVECFKNYQTIRSLFERYHTDTYLMKTPLMSSLFYEELKAHNPWEPIHNTMTEFKETLEESIYGHTQAKRQLERILGQWMRGEQTGYCFGFEGPPGVGKTSLAKYGLAKCLRNENGEPRPFSFIALGGSTHGNTLEGHNYTYLGSTWGKLVDILMETKCMNPIIFIDELDKVSRTEQGREIIGILTHLVDPTQNTHIQDKYFNGVDIDFSKALIIFSYNDVDAIDRILLDRIHRIRFSPLSVDEKCVIVKKYLIPELEKKFYMKLNGFTDEIILFLIHTYTQEAGVRKLKEILFEIVSEYNLETISASGVAPQFTIDLCKTYLKERHPIIIRKVEPTTYGIVNGMWANSYGNGGVLTIEAQWSPQKEPMHLTLTGSQGDVMKESMTVARTVAWNMLSKKAQEKLMEQIQGIHIHCPEGATPKDGPSAGCAISLAMLSLMMRRAVPYHIAITGELSLNQKVTAIGGLEAKVLGAVRAGVSKVFYPVENERDMEKIKEKYPELEIEVEGISEFQELVDKVWEGEM